MIRRPVTTEGRSQCWTEDQEMSWSERKYTPWPRWAECWILDWCWSGLWETDGTYSELWGKIYDKKIYIS